VPSGKDAVMIEKLRNIAIIAHVDHGKTTLVDCLLKQSQTFSERFATSERMMDSNDLEKERGITILAKNTAISWNGYRINIVDTPGHADFGGEVERVLSMVDSVLLLVDAVDGPMPQTRFVTQKAFQKGLNPIVVINKVDRNGARPSWVVDQTFDLFDRLGANDTQLDFPIVYASALMGYAGMEDTVREGDMNPLFQAIVDRVKAPAVDVDGGFQMQISQLDYSSYVGVIGIGRIQRGKIKSNSQVVIIDREGVKRTGKIVQILGFMGLTRAEVPEAQAGDIVAITGIEKLGISDTICHPDFPEALPPLMVDEPTISMFFCVNNSPFAGKEGKYLTSRQIRERLMKEVQTNVALRVEETEDPDKFKVSGRGELHLSILIETMRREGYEMALSRPEVIKKVIDGEMCEPYEQVVIDLEEVNQGTVMSRLLERKAQLKNMENDGKGRTRLEFMMPSRGLIGFQTEFKTLTGGTGLMFHVFDHYGPTVAGTIAARPNGVMISNGSGITPAYAQYSLQERGRLFVVPGDEIYEGQIVGIHAKDNDLTVNATKAKQLTNFRAAGKDDNLMLTPPVRFSLEQSIEFVEDDELCEVTPTSIRLRKKHLTENQRVQAGRGKRT
jgi:GTP-binding protein